MHRLWEYLEARMPEKGSRTKTVNCKFSVGTARMLIDAEKSIEKEKLLFCIDVELDALQAAADYHRKEFLRHEVAQKIGRPFPPGNHAVWEQFHRAIWYACENAANKELSADF